MDAEARRGTHPPAPKDQHTKSADIFSPCRPAGGANMDLVMPRRDANAVQWHFNETHSQVAAGAHAVVLPDRAGRHTTSKHDVPASITRMPLPP